MQRDVLVNDLRTYLNHINYTSLLPPQEFFHRKLTAPEHNTLVLYAQDGDEECFELATIFSTKVVCSIAGQYRTRHSLYNGKKIDDDLIQAGFLGVVQAILVWDNEKGNFLSYAYWFIKKQVLREIHAINCMITVPDQKRQRLIPQLEYLMCTYRTETLTPTSQGFAEWLNKNNYSEGIKNGQITDRDVANMIKISRITYLELEQDVEQQDFYAYDSGRRSWNCMPIDPNPLPDERLVNNEATKTYKQLSEKLLEVLTNKQRDVVSLYYGIEPLSNVEFKEYGHRRTTFVIVADILSKRYQKTLSASSCRELHKRAMRKLQKCVKDTDIALFKHFETIV